MSNEEEPKFYVNSGEEQIECTRQNASLFMFWGELASRNHVFVEKQEEEDKYLGAYVFGQIDHVAAYMINNGFTCHINLHEVPECDEAAYQRHVEQVIAKERPEIGDYMPEEWERGA